jgi:hypothetical protein
MRFGVAFVRPPNAHAELHAGPGCRPHRGTLAAAPEGVAGGSEMAAGVTPCSWLSPARERPACQLERGVRRWSTRRFNRRLCLSSTVGDLICAIADLVTFGVSGQSVIQYC